MIDWSLAQRIAGLVAGDPPPPPPPRDLPALAERAEGLVSAYTGLVPAAAIPGPESVSRPEWIAANLRSMRVLMNPVVERLGDGMGPLRGAVRAAGGVVIGAEIGVMVGYLGQRVLGQYDLVLLDAEAPTRLLFVAPNLEVAAGQLGADREELLTWVALHEVTHALQFGGVPWLREHLAGLIRELVAGLEVSVDLRRSLRLPSSDDLRGMVDAVRGGDLISLVATPEQRATIDRLQATMAVIEGHAEHVMDAVGRDLLPSLSALRAALDRRRRTQSVVARFVNRLLGLELKMRQYELGKSFVDAVVEARGNDALAGLWTDPDALPTLAELHDPNSWVARRLSPSVTS